MHAECVPGPYFCNQVTYLDEDTGEWQAFKPELGFNANGYADALSGEEVFLRENNCILFECFFGGLRYYSDFLGLIFVCIF